MSTTIQLEGEGQTRVQERVRRKCANCGEPATQRHTFLRENPRKNPYSRAYGRDDVSHCEDANVHVCDECARRVAVPHGHVENSRYFLQLESGDPSPYAHLFLVWQTVPDEAPKADGE